MLDSQRVQRIGGSEPTLHLNCLYLVECITVKILRQRSLYIRDSSGPLGREKRVICHPSQ